MAHACCMEPHNRICYHLLAVLYTNLIQCLRLMTCPEKNAHSSSLRSCQTARKSEAHLYENNSENTSSGQQLLELIHTISGHPKPGWAPHFSHTKLDYLCAHFTSILDVFQHPLPSLSTQNGAPVYTGVRFSQKACAARVTSAYDGHINLC